jgi:hypothetical protein
MFRQAENIPMSQDFTPCKKHQIRNIPNIPFPNAEIDIILKIDCLMAHTACLVCLGSTVSGCSKNTI